MSANARAKGRILLVDDDPGLLRLLSIRLRAEDYIVEAVDSAQKALASLARFRPDLVITDLKMDKMDGIGLLKELQSRSPGLRSVIITAHGTIPDAVVATQSGAVGFLTKPIDKDELKATIERALVVSGSADAPGSWAAGIVTRNEAMKELLRRTKAVAVSDVPILITGASGTGKKLLARAIHQASPRRDRNFVAIGCSALSGKVLDAELFGNPDAATSGDDLGQFRHADGGTLFLDEIGDIPLALQAKLLRVIEERRIRAAESGAAFSVDVRLIAASQTELHDSIAQGLFREDLYFRLNAAHVHLPPLEFRRDDIPLLLAHFLQFIGKEEGQERKVYAPEAVELLVAADWPGNIRQLQNIVRQNVALSRSPVISAEIVQQSLGEHAGKLMSFADARDEFTRNYLSQILQITMGNVSQAARLAKRNRTDFYKLLARHDLNPDQFKTHR